MENKEWRDLVCGNIVRVMRHACFPCDLMLLLARTTPVEDCKKRTDGLSCFLIDLREAQGNGCDIKPLGAMINHNTTEVFFDNLRIPGSSLIGEEGKGFRYILDGMNAERVLIAAESLGDGKFFIKKGVM